MPVRVGLSSHLCRAFYTSLSVSPSDSQLFSMLYKKTRELFRRMTCFRGEVASDHPQFPEDSAASCKKTEGPIPIDAPDIVYTPEDDKAIEEYIRNRGK